MVASCGQDKPHRNPKKVNFSCIIGIYLMSFFYDHPVDVIRAIIKLNETKEKALDSKGLSVEHLLLADQSTG